MKVLNCPVNLPIDVSVEFALMLDNEQINEMKYVNK